MGATIIRSERTIDGLEAIVWEYVEDGQVIAHLDAHVTGLILNVEVTEDRRGEGIARRLYEHADSELDLYHIPAWGRTDEGDAFAQAMGGPTMDDQQAADILGLDLEVVTGAFFEE